MYSLTESPIRVPLLCTRYYMITTTSKEKLLIVLFESALDQAYSTHGNRQKVIVNYSNRCRQYYCHEDCANLRIRC